MQRQCFLLRVKEGKLKAYLKAHKVVWQDMLEAIKECGISNYSLFYREDGMLVGYLEGDNIDASLAMLDKTKANIKWQKNMSPYLEKGKEKLTFYFHTA